jgi:hypothetical protein
MPGNPVSPRVEHCVSEHLHELRDGVLANLSLTTKVELPHRPRQLHVFRGRLVKGPGIASGYFYNFPSSRRSYLKDMNAPTPRCPSPSLQRKQMFPIFLFVI